MLYGWERDMQPLSTDVSAQAVWWPLCATKMTQSIGALNMSRYHRKISAGQFSHRISRLLTAAAVAILATSLPHTAFAQQQPEFTDLGMSTAEAPAIKNMAAQGVITAAAPGKFDPAAPMKRGDFAIALQRLFNLPQPRNSVKFSDVHPTDALYTAVEAVEPYMDKQVPCPGCDIGTKFSPEKAVSRAQSAITLVRILVVQNKLQLVSDAQSDKILSSVPDAADLPKRTRPYIATAIQAGILNCCAGNAIEATQLVTRADTAETLNNTQRRFDIPVLKQGA
jgi:hypothetical protein